MSKKKGSWCWSFYTEADDEKAICNLCNTQLSRKGGSTSGLVKHLNNVHKKFDGSKSAESTEAKQSRVTDYMTKPKKEMPRAEYVAITKAAASMCATDIRPLDIVEGEGFRKYSAALNPSYEVWFYCLNNEE